MFPVILIVEDSQDIGWILSSTLEEAGYQTRITREGHEAIRLAREMQPKLITLDLGLPGMSGWDVLRQLRADALTREIPIVAISAFASELDQSAQGQVARVIGKPFYLSEVVDAISEVLGSAYQEDAAEAQVEEQS